MSHPSFVDRFLQNLQALGLRAPEAHLVVAVSGGCDSVCLLHLLRHRAGAAAPRITAAHFDHAMRPDSAADAEWVAGLCRAWDVPLISARARAAPVSETAARRARHRFLRQAARQAGAARVATGHHADDQAETVLFRVLRGTGLAGLAGITPSSPASPIALVRPLLPFWREEIEAYARGARLRWRADPTNRSLGPARNRLRHQFIPELERWVAPGARRNLVRLAELAREAEAGWAQLLEPIERELVTVEPGALVLARAPLRRYHPALGTRLLRTLMRRFGSPPSRAGTRLALQFITDAPSGRVLQLAGGLRLATEYDRVRITVDADPEPDRELRIDDPGVPGTGEFRIGGRRYRASWSDAPPGDAPAGAPSRWQAAFEPGALVFPLQLRGWRPGDRIRLRGGTRRLKRLFGDRRVPGSARARVPLLVDAQGTVHWVAGLAQNVASRARPGHDAFHLALGHG